MYYDLQCPIVAIDFMTSAANSRKDWKGFSKKLVTRVRILN